MKIFGLAVDEKAQSPVLILKNEAQDLALPIWVGPVEAMAISLALNAVETPRPRQTLPWSLILTVASPRASLPPVTARIE